MLADQLLEEAEEQRSGHIEQVRTGRGFQAGQGGDGSRQGGGLLAQQSLDQTRTQTDQRLGARPAGKQPGQIAEQTAVDVRARQRLQQAAGAVGCGPLLDESAEQGRQDHAQPCLRARLRFAEILRSLLDDFVTQRIGQHFQNIQSHVVIPSCRFDHRRPERIPASPPGGYRQNPLADPLPPIAIVLRGDGGDRLRLAPATPARRRGPDATPAPQPVRADRRVPARCCRR